MDQISPEPFDMILRGDRVIDPAQGLDGIADVAIRGGRIAAVAPIVPGPAKEVVDVQGRLVLPGMIDTHAHVYRYVSGRFGLDADMVGVRSGVTTVVDQGGPSVLTFPGFREYAAKPMATRVLAFICAYMVGGLEGHYYPELYRPDCIAVDDTVRVARENADMVRGVKGHAEIGGFTRWGDSAMRKAAAIARQVDRPLYIHCCCGKTCWRRLGEWHAAGVWAELHRVLLERLHDAGALDWHRAALDSASLRSKRGARRSGPIRRTAASQARNATWSPTPRARRSASR